MVFSGMLISMKNLIKINRKRTLSSVIDTFIFFPWIFPLLPILVGDILNTNIDTLLILLLPILFFIYFGVIVKLTNGYTLGGFLTKTRTVSIEKKEITSISYAKRTLSGIVSIFKMFFTGSKTMNGIGQYKYDEKYHMTVLPKDILLSSLDKKEIQIHHYLFDIVLLYLKYSFFYIITLGIIISLIKMI